MDHVTIYFLILVVFHGLCWRCGDEKMVAFMLLPNFVIIGS